MRAERESGADAERAERAGIEPAQRPARLHDVRCGRDEVAAVGDQHGVVAGDALERAEKCDRIDVLAGARRLRIDLALARIVARAQLRDPVVAPSALADALRQSLERQSGVTDQREVRTSVQARSFALRLAAISVAARRTWRP